MKPMRSGYFILLIIILLGSCRKDFSTILSSGELEFSRDTIFLDTVFTNISSSTRTLKVYNRSNKDISIPTIALGRGENSFYRLNVDGIPGKTFENIPILANDSIFIFIEATIDFSQVVNPLYTDAILFDAANNVQDVDLVTLVQDAIFYFPERDANRIKETISLGLDDEGNALAINGRLLEDSELTWTAEKPHVVYDFIGVPEGKTLTIEAGAKVFFHTNSGLLVQENGSLKVMGALDQEVVFEGDRLEPAFSDVAGQWGTIWLRSGSVANEIDYAIIKNGIIGLLVDDMSSVNPTLTLRNTQIYNASNFGVLGRSTHIVGENLVIGAAGQASLAATAGGKYDFVHSTFANHWTGGFRQFPAVLLNNFFLTQDGNNEIVNGVHLEFANFTNCIIDGNQGVEFIADAVSGVDFNFKLTNSLLKFDTTNQELLSNPLYDFTNTSIYENSLLNAVTDFRNPVQNDLIIGENSQAIGAGLLSGALSVPFDILGVDRTSVPDIGAYQHIVFEP